MFYFKGKEIKDVYLVVDGSFIDPHEAIETIYMPESDDPLLPEARDEFINDNLEILTEMVLMTHQQWAEAQMQIKMDFDAETSALHRTLH